MHWMEYYSGLERSLIMERSQDSNVPFSIAESSFYYLSLLHWQFELPGGDCML